MNAVSTPKLAYYTDLSTNTNIGRETSIFLFSLFTFPGQNHRLAPIAPLFTLHPTHPWRSSSQPLSPINTLDVSDQPTHIRPLIIDQHLLSPPARPSTNSHHAASQTIPANNDCGFSITVSLSYLVAMDHPRHHLQRVMALLWRPPARRLAQRPRGPNQIAFLSLDVHF